MEILSKRKITVQLILLRCLSGCLLLLVAFLFASGRYDYAIFFMVLLIPISLAGINQVIIADHEVTVCKHRFFASVCYKYKFTAANILMVASKEQAFEAEDPDHSFLNALS